MLPFLQLRRVPPPRQLALLVPYVRVQHKPPRVSVRVRVRVMGTGKGKGYGYGFGLRPSAVLR